MKKLFVLMSVTLSAMSIQAQKMPYQDVNLSAEERAEDLVLRLTLEEKASLMMHQSAAVPRLGIGAFQWWNEALHGVARNGVATVFPITMGMAASWDEALLQDVYTAVSDEGRAKAQAAKRSGRVKQYQGLSFWTPNINIFRDPRWGRGQETYGEDPYLTSRMGVAVVRGLQGPDDAKYRKSLACAKHFAVHSGPEWNRHSFDIVNLPERDLWETYLPAFKALIQEANVEEVMCAYQSMDGEPCCGNNRYLHQILREELGFKGMVTSDCWAISDFFKSGAHEVVADEQAASAMAVRAGTDVECGPHYASLPEAVRAGQVTEDEINTSLKRLIVARMRLGDFDPDEMVEWTKIPESVVGCDEHRQLALKMARESIVLLQNKGGILPLAKSGQKVVVMGPNANDSTMLWGNYNGFPKYTVTILDGIRSKCADVKYVGGCGHTANTAMDSRFASFVQPDGTKGMKATYYAGDNLEGAPIATMMHTSPIILNNGGATVFAPGVPLEHFSARYEGLLCADGDEDVTFRVDADDAMRLIVDGDTIIKCWHYEEPAMHKYKTVKVKAGQKVKVQLDYRQRMGVAMLHFDVTARTTLSTEGILAQAGDADVVVFVGGISPRLEGEEMKVDAEGFKGGDRTSIELPAVQRNMMKALHDMGKKVVFVNCSGSAMAMQPETINCDAIIQAWYGGEQGGVALADVLFGDCNPSGKLPVTFYKNTDQLPDFLEYSMKGRTYRFMTESPLFPFGYGLSYTTYKIDKVKYKGGKITAEITNTGNVDGDEVIQAYIRRVGDADGPRKTLKAYKRVSVKAGETVKVEMELPRERFEWWDADNNTMHVLPGNYELMVGNSSEAEVVQVVKVK